MPGPNAPLVYTNSMGTFTWWWRAEWRQGPWVWLAALTPAMLLGASYLPDPVGGSEGPRSYFDGLAKVLILVGWAVRMARDSRELPTWSHQPWKATLARLACALIAPLCVVLPGLVVLSALSEPSAATAALPSIAWWVLQLGPWAVLSTLVIPGAAAPCFLVLMPFLAGWMAPECMGGPLQGLLPDGTPPESTVDFLRRLAAGTLVVAVAATGAGASGRGRESAPRQL